MTMKNMKREAFCFKGQHYEIKIMLKTNPAIIDTTIEMCDARAEALEALSNFAAQCHVQEAEYASLGTVGYTSPIE